MSIGVTSSTTLNTCPNRRSRDPSKSLYKLAETNVDKELLNTVYTNHYRKNVNNTLEANINEYTSPVLPMNINGGKKYVLK